jgi:peptidoglycan/LPS O-acetylase OafA/YrhL
MCQTILGPVLGSNGPLWSLANEAWYYLAGPLLFVLLFGRKTSSRMVGIIGLAFVVWFLPGSILVYALVWLLGAGLYFINGRVLLPLWVSLVLFGVSFVNARLLWIPNGYITDFLIGISFALVINSAAGGSHRILGHVWSNAAAAFSYSVYLCHCSFLIFVVSWLFHLGWIDPSRSPTPRLAGIFLLVLLAAYVWCYLISLVTERQTSRIRAWLGKHLIQKLGIGV